MNIKAAELSILSFYKISLAQTPLRCFQKLVIFIIYLSFRYALILPVFKIFYLKIQILFYLTIFTS